MTALFELDVDAVLAVVAVVWVVVVACPPSVSSLRALPPPRPAADEAAGAPAPASASARTAQRHSDAARWRGDFD